VGRGDDRIAVGCEPRTEQRQGRDRHRRLGRQRSGAGTRGVRAVRRNKEIHYVIAGGRSGVPGGDNGSSSAITQWVTAKFTATTVDGQTVYDLTT
jgi:hypothetical protein